MDFEARYHRWLRRLEAEELSGFLVTHLPNLSYLFHFRGTAGMALCLDGESTLIVDSRYLEVAQTETRNCRAVLAPVSLLETMQDLIARQPPGSRIGFESRHLSHDLATRIQESTTVQWVASRDLVETLRMIKDSREIAALEKAFQIAAAVWRRFPERVRAGLTELELAGLLEYELRKEGAQGFAFEPMVASGPRSSLPHASPTRKQLREGDLVLFDFGIRFDDYCSDMTRVVLLDESRRPPIYSIVAEAQQRALSRVKPGALSTEIDRAARHWIAENGYGDRFGHGTGHGLGLEVHELPTISPRREFTLREGMVFTLEPGIYLPGEVGVRIEDAVVVTGRGCRLLSE